MDEAIQMKNEKLFTPSSGPVLKILPCSNGWGIALQHPYETDCSEDEVEYVFNSAAELAKAVANLVQFGTLERPPEVAKLSEIVGLQSGMRPVSEFTTPDLDDVSSPLVTLWFRFTTAQGLVDRFCDHENNSCSPTHLSEKQNIFQWMHQVGATYFRPLSVGELLA